VGVDAFDIRMSVRGWLAHKTKEKPTDADRARRERAEADLAEAKAAKLKGELIPVAKAEATWTGICRDIRAGLLAVPSRVRARLPALTTAEVGVIDSEVRLALTSLGDAGG
jgi:phage terminase Nu1 subunit (DNA packaging protein)